MTDEERRGLVDGLSLLLGGIGGAFAKFSWDWLKPAPMREDAATRLASTIADEVARIVTSLDRHTEAVNTIATQNARILEEQARLLGRLEGMNGRARS